MKAMVILGVVILIAVIASTIWLHRMHGMNLEVGMENQALLKRIAEFG